MQILSLQILIIIQTHYYNHCHPLPSRQLPSCQLSYQYSIDFYSPLVKNEIKNTLPDEELSWKKTNCALETLVSYQINKINNNQIIMTVKIKKFYSSLLLWYQNSKFFPQTSKNLILQNLMVRLYMIHWIASND